MDMYRDSYVAALLVDGKIQKESDDGTVLIPFGSEYVLRLKNKLRKRAVADVWIDGKIAVKGVVIDANETVDLERFVTDGNLNEGKRFKLARLTDPKVDQPNDSENGNIEVNFYPEKDQPEVEKKIIHEYKHECFNHYSHWGHCSWCCNSYYCSICHPKGTVTWGSSSTSYTSDNTGAIIRSLSADSNITLGSNSLNVQNNIDLTKAVNTIYSAEASSLGQVTNSALPTDTVFMNASMSTGEAAATVEGSTSLQKFSSVYIDVDRSKPTTIRLIVKGLSKVINVCECGYRRKKDVKFCPNDGIQLVA